MRTGTVKGGFPLCGIVAVGAALFGQWQGYWVGETLIAAVIPCAFVVGIAWIGSWRNAGSIANKLEVTDQIAQPNVRFWG